MHTPMQQMMIINRRRNTPTVEAPIHMAIELCMLCDLSHIIMGEVEGVAVTVADSDGEADTFGLLIVLLTPILSTIKQANY